MKPGPWLEVAICGECGHIVQCTHGFTFGLHACRECGATFWTGYKVARRVGRAFKRRWEVKDA